jgi:membrane protease YdiL (CAAX protease family)
MHKESANHPVKRTGGPVSLLPLAAVVPAYLVIAFGLFGVGRASVAVVGYHLVLAGGVALFVRGHRSWGRGWREILGPAPGPGGWAAAAVMAGAVANSWLEPNAGHVQEVLRRWGVPFVSTTFANIYTPLVNPTLEELFWRGALLRSLAARVGPTRGLVLMAVLFTGYHALPLVALFSLSVVVLSLAVTLLGGLLFGLLVRWSGGLWLPLAVHVAADVCVVLVRGRLLG